MDWHELDEAGAVIKKNANVLRAERAVKDAAQDAFGGSYRALEAKTFVTKIEKTSELSSRYNQRGTQFMTLVEGEATLNGLVMEAGAVIRLDVGQVFDLSTSGQATVVSHIFPYRPYLADKAYALPKGRLVGPKVSLIVIAKNIENHIDHCLLSCALQTHKNIEVVVVVDQSKDQTAARAKAWADRDKRFLIEVADQSLGPNGARKLGLKTSSGDYCLFVDGDDWINFDAVERLASVAKTQNSECVVFGFDHHNDKTQAMWDQVLPTTVSVVEGPLFYSREAHWALGVSTLNHTVWMYFFARRLADHTERALLDISLYEDLPFFLTLLEHANVTTICNQVLYHYRRDRLGQVTQNWNGVSPGRKIAALEVAVRHALGGVWTDHWFYQAILLYKIERIYLFERRVCLQNQDVESVLGWDRCWLRLLALFPDSLSASITHEPTRKRFTEAKRPLKRAIMFNRRARRLRGA